VVALARPHGVVEDEHGAAQRKIAELEARIADAQRARTLIKHALECPHDDLLACTSFRSALEARLNTLGRQQ
jgi:hypothetical protein